MTLQKYFADKPHGSIAAMAKTLNISRTWFSLIINNRATPSPMLAIMIEKLTKGEVTRKTLRPDLYR
jgi:DNA-binding transcriptional regulator YdaS (Cro superfamily)